MPQGVVTPQPPGGWLDRAAPARRWVIGVGLLAALLVGSVPILAVAYSSDELITIYGIAVLALLCQAAETVDAWRASEAARRSPAAAPGASLASVMRWVVVSLVAYLGLVGLSNLGSGLAANGSGSQTRGDLVAAGTLMTMASALSLLLFWRGWSWVPGLRSLRAGRAVSWLGIAALLEALAQNLSPASGATSVAATIARPATTGDLILGSLPLGAIAVFAVGPVVRRNAMHSLRRLGLVPQRLAWAGAGLASGVVLVPTMNATFGASELTGREAVLHLGPLALLLMALGTVGPRAAIVGALRPPGHLDSVDETVPPPAGGSAGGGLARVIVLAAVSFAVVDAAGLVVSLFAQRLPADCVAQQIRVSQSLSGGPTGRAWYANCGIALTAALDEELLFRGLIQPRFGLIVASVIFASFHLQYTCHGLPSVGALEIVVLGFLFGILRQRGGLGAAILCHAAYDATLLLGYG